MSYWSSSTDQELRADREALLHSDAVGERVDPNIPQLISLGIIQTRECIVCAFHQVPIALDLGKSQEILMIVDMARPKELHSLKEIDICLAHLTTDQRFAENECEEIAGCQMPGESVFA